MKKTIIFCLALFVFCSLHTSVAGEDRELAITPAYEEDYGTSSANNSSSSSGSGTNSSSNRVYGGPNPSNNITSNQTYFVPTTLLTGFVVDIHFLAGDTNIQYIAYHYCSELYPGYTQCDIYNGAANNSKLVAVEVIVNAEIFAQLPMEERKLWHSHAFAVTSGILVSPNIPPEQELAVMALVMNTYGKVTDFYHSYQSFPYGGAKLAYGLAADSQIIPALADQLDQALGLGTTWRQRAVQRQSLNPTILPGADDYLTSGQFPQFIIQWFPVPSETGESGEVGGAVVGSGEVPSVGAEESGETPCGVGAQESGESSGNGGGSPEEGQVISEENSFPQ